MSDDIKLQIAQPIDVKEAIRRAKTQLTDMLEGEPTVGFVSRK